MGPEGCRDCKNKMKTSRHPVSRSAFGVSYYTVHSRPGGDRSSTAAPKGGINSQRCITGKYEPPRSKKSRNLYQRGGESPLINKVLGHVGYSALRSGTVCPHRRKVSIGGRPKRPAEDSCHSFGEYQRAIPYKHLGAKKVNETKGLRTKTFLRVQVALLKKNAKEPLARVKSTIECVPRRGNDSAQEVALSIWAPARGK